MKKILFIFCLFVLNEVPAKNSLNPDPYGLPVKFKDWNYLPRYTVGLVPYQVFSRSCGLYVSRLVSKSLRIELRPTYTIATHFYSYLFYHGDNFDFQGYNMQLLLTYEKDELVKPSLILGYSNWWYENYWVFGASNDNPYSLLKSTRMSGPLLGFELARESSFKRMDFKIFMNFSCKFFQIKSTIYDDNVNYPPGYQYTPAFPISKSFHDKKYSFTLGIKLGWRSKNSTE